jgi:hypothetical protein
MVKPMKDIEGRACPECGELRQATGMGWAGSKLRQTFRCVNKVCPLYGKIRLVKKEIK